MAEDEGNQYVLLDEDDNKDEKSNVDPSGFYAALGVNEKATQQEIRRAFLALSQRYHTDKHIDQSREIQDAMNERFQMLQEAYTTLSDERQRAAYDSSGAKGVERLALVPANLTKRVDVANYLQSLEREAALVRTAKMLSASSDIKVTYSTAALFIPTRRVVMSSKGDSEAPSLPQELTAAAAAEAPSHQEHTTKEGAGTAAEAAAAPPPSKDAVHKGAAHPTPPQGSDTPPPPADAAHPGKPAAATHDGADAKEGGGGPHKEQRESQGAVESLRGVQAQMVAKEVIVDGKPVIVFIPSEEMQGRIRKGMQEAAARAQEGGAARAHAPSSSQQQQQHIRQPAGALAQGRVRRQSNFTVHNLLVATVPKSVTFTHSFEHAVNPRTDITVLTDARSDANGTSVSYTASIMHQRSPVQLYTAALRSSVNGLKLTFVNERTLTPLWVLRTKTTLLRNAHLLDKLEMTLIRKLSFASVLENTLALSLTEAGFFKSSAQLQLGQGQCAVSTYISHHGMEMTAYTVQAVTYGEGWGRAGARGKDAAARGKVQYSITCSPFTGQSHIGFESWYFRTPRQHYGLSFMSIVPFSFCPFAPPLFFVRCERYAVVNEVSLLYARGQHRVRIPIIAFVSPRVTHALVWLGLPLTAYRIAQLLYRPYAHARAARHFLRLRREHVAEVDIARAKALLEQRAIEPSILQLRAAEDRKGGLVIIKAEYGVLHPAYVLRGDAAAEVPAAADGAKPRELLGKKCLRLLDALRSAWRGGAKRQKDEERKEASSLSPSTNDIVDEDSIPLTLDVTIALQSLVRDSALSLPSASKSTITGFYDPDPYTAEKKELRVEYWFKKQRCMVTVDDEASLQLPSEAHLVASPSSSSSPS